MLKKNKTHCYEQMQILYTYWLSNKHMAMYQFLCFFKVAIKDAGFGSLDSQLFEYLEWRIQIAVGNKHEIKFMMTSISSISIH